LVDTDSREGPGVPAGFERGRRRLPLVIVALIVLGAFAALGFTMFNKSVVYYRTPTEVLAQPGAHVRISGTVVAGSISSDVAVGTVAFKVTDGKSTVAVLFAGPAPDTLRDQGEAVAEGALGSDGVFHADKLFARCPSKFSVQTPSVPGG
jgi:cytochrome c-type biogenesis protein CcmE